MASITTSETDAFELCGLCQKSLPKIHTNVNRLLCCGKGCHTACYPIEQIKIKPSCLLCGTKHIVTGSSEDIKQLRHWVEQDKPWAQLTLGHRYEHGIGVEQSQIQATKLFITAAANHNYSFAQFNLGLYYEQGGKGVEQNIHKAREMYEAAAEQGHLEAMANLGFLYAVNGNGIPQSYIKAREWWEKGAIGGFEPAINNLKKLDQLEGKTETGVLVTGKEKTTNGIKTKTKKKKQKPNARCECGSTKKYKKCCGSTRNKKR